MSEKMSEEISEEMSTYHNIRKLFAKSKKRREKSGSSDAKRAPKRSEENGVRERKNACWHPRVFFVSRGLQRPRISIGLECKL